MPVGSRDRRAPRHLQSHRRPPAQARAHPVCNVARPGPVQPTRRGVNTANDAASPAVSEFSGGQVVIAFSPIGLEPVRSIATHQSVPTYAPTSADTRLKTTPETSRFRWRGTFLRELARHGRAPCLTRPPLHTRAEGRHDQASKYGSLGPGPGYRARINARATGAFAITGRMGGSRGRRRVRGPCPRGVGARTTVAARSRTTAVAAARPSPSSCD